MTPATIVYNCDCKQIVHALYFIFVADWNKDPEAYFNHYCSGWDERSKEEVQH